MHAAKKRKFCVTLTTPFSIGPLGVAFFPEQRNARIISYCLVPVESGRSSAAYFCRLGRVLFLVFLLSYLHLPQNHFQYLQQLVHEYSSAVERTCPSILHGVPGCCECTCYRRSLAPVHAPWCNREAFLNTLQKPIVIEQSVASGRAPMIGMRVSST